MPKNQIIYCWNEVEESLQSVQHLTHNLVSLSDDEKQEMDDYCNAIISRLRDVLEVLGEHFTDEEAQAHLKL